MLWRSVAVLVLTLLATACSDTTTRADTAAPDETITLEIASGLETLCVDDPALETGDGQVCAVDAGYDGIRGAQFGESVVVGFVDDDVDRVLLVAGPDLASVDETEIETTMRDGRRVFIADIDWRETLAVIAERGAEQYVHVNERLSGPGRQDPQILVADGTVLISGQPVGWMLRVSRGRTLSYQLESADGALGGAWGVGPTGTPEPFDAFVSDFGWNDPVPVVIALVRTPDSGTVSVRTGADEWTAETAALPHGDHVAVVIADRALGAEAWTLEFTTAGASSFRADITERLRATLPFVPPGYPTVEDAPAPLPTVTYPSS